MILNTEQDFLKEVKRITGNRGVNVVYDSVVHDTFDRSLTPLGTLATPASQAASPRRRCSAWPLPARSTSASVAPSGWRRPWRRTSRSAGRQTIRELVLIP